MSGWPFDGAEAIHKKLEHGESFGLSKDQYGALAHVAMGALRWAGVEPCEIRLLHDRRDGQIIPGADVVLYGTDFVFTVRMEPLKERSTLYFLPIDSQLGGPGCLLYEHKFEGNDYVGPILAAMLKHEDQGFQEYLREIEGL